MASLDADALRAVITELSVLAGGRIQRVDLLSPHDVLLEIRHPGRTLRLLLSGARDHARVHLVEARPPREMPANDQQRAFRKRLEGRPLVALECEGMTVFVDGRDARLSVRLDATKNIFQWLPPRGIETPSPPATLPEHFPLSEALVARYAASAPEDAATRLRREHLRRTAAKKKKLIKLADNLGRDREKLVKMGNARATAELIKSQLHTIPKGASEARVMNWETGAEVVVPLDPARSAKQNMERIFARAKKAERGLPIVEKRLHEVETDLEAWTALEAEIRAADLPQLVEIDRRRTLAPEPERAARVDKKDKKPIDRWSRRFEAGDGTEIRVGRGAKENDRLTFGAARGDDIWMHASGSPGAHVILRVSKGATPNPESILDAATLAAFYSGQKNDSKVEIVYTEARYVKKNKGDPPGRVSVARGKTLLLVLDPARLERLFQRAQLTQEPHR